MLKPRIIAQAILFGLLLGVAYVVVRTFVSNYIGSQGLKLANEQIFGGDFICFYVAGQLVNTNLPELYNFKLQHDIQQNIVSVNDVSVGLLPFAYPPLMALIFAQLAHLSLQRAFYIWTGTGILVTYVTILGIAREHCLQKKLVGILCVAILAFLPFSFEVLAGGQTSWIAIAIFGSVYLLMKRRNDFLAGLMLGLGYYKPPLFVFFALSSLLQKRWKLMCGALTSGVALLIGSILFIGLDGLTRYLSTVSSYTYGRELLPGYSLPPAMGAGLYSFAITALSEDILTARAVWACTLITALFAFQQLKLRLDDRTAFFDLVVAAEICCSILFSVQMVIYDMSVLLVPMVVFICYSSRNTLTRVSSGLLGLTILLIYSEWPFRKIGVFGGTYHPITLLVAIFVILLLREAWLFRQSKVSQ